ncbi:hypothetical protein [Rhodobacteraceae bacterium DSL-40]|uniref:hypothetical protein n=1 Tax=Amaricoccus sp. B4 TaxID=3368557 RepID=UPI000DACC095
MHHHDITPGEIQAARVAAAFKGWLRNHGEILIATADALGGAEAAKLARSVATSVAQGADALDHFDELRPLRDLIANYVGGSQPAVYREGDLIVECDPNAPHVVGAQICANALDRAIEALQALKTAKIRRVPAGGLA